MTRERLLTRTWNNRLTLLLGGPAAVWAALTLGTSLMTELTGFLGMVGFAVVY